MSVVAASALLKFSDLPAFLMALGTWRLVPGWAASLLTVMVPTAELTISGLWFGGGSIARLSRWFVIVLLILWTGAYIIETVFWGPPNCGCFGRLRDWYLLKHEAPWVIARNLTLVVMLVVGTDPRRRAAGCPAPVREPQHAGLRESGFTLIETILVVALIGLLVTLGLPSLSTMRGRALSIRALSDLRSHAQTVATYGIDYKDSFPCILNPAYTHTVVVLPTTNLRESLPYFAQRFYWWVGLAEPYYNGDAMSPSFFAPRRHGSGRGEPYYYSVSCLARPEYWKLETRTPKGQIGPVRLGDVLYPSRKGLFVTWEGTSTSGRFSRSYSLPEAAFCDGAAQVVRSDRLMPSVQDGEGPWGWPFAFDHIGDPITHTVNGVRGRDIR